MSKTQEYIDQYKEFAIQQMKRYGIPASVTLAQGILESSNGRSQLAQNENNHFGIKATKAWLAAGGGYGVYTDDRPNEKFCKYASVGDSYEHHSQFLKNNTRYAACFKLSPDDYKGWCMGLDKAGYATSGTYGPSLIKTIERLNLQDIDRQVMAEMRAEGRTFGQGATQTLPTGRSAAPMTQTAAQSPSTAYSMPVQRDEFLLVTSPYGMRMHPIDHVNKMHNGIDIKTNHEAVLATEQGGKVIDAGFDTKGGGNYVKLEYSREDGSKTQLTFCHLSEIKVKVGDTLQAGQPLGVSGSTGKSTGDHLHFSVKQVSPNGNVRQVDPAAYLAEIAQKGNLQQQALLNGQDLLAKYKSQDPNNGNALAQVNPEMSADDWMKKLRSSEDSGLDLGMNGGDPIVDMVTGAFTTLMAIAVQIDNKTEEDKKQMVTEAATTKSINLAPYMPNHSDCSISLQEGGKAILKVDGQARALSQADLSSLSNILGSSLTDDAKMKRVAVLVDNIVLSGKASQNYEQAVNQSQEQTNTIQR